MAVLEESFDFRELTNSETLKAMIPPRQSGIIHGMSAPGPDRRLWGRTGMNLEQDHAEKLDGPAPACGEPTHSRTLGILVKGKNINEETLLATDYLNHFNEIIMLLDMIPMMPECLEDARAWAPKTYEAHFQDSAFTDKHLAILAYQNAPVKYRAPFDDTIERMNALVASGLVEIERAVETGEPGRIELAVTGVSRSLQKLVDVASAIIHGNQDTIDQSEVDAILNS